MQGFPNLEFRPAMTKPRKRKARRTNKIERRAIAPYIRELERSRVPRSTIRQARTAMMILLRK
jgi:hypothetical protein